MKLDETRALFPAERGYSEVVSLTSVVSLEVIVHCYGIEI